jgi:hypothetical protein
MTQGTSVSSSSSNPTRSTLTTRTTTPRKVSPRRLTFPLAATLCRTSTPVSDSKLASTSWTRLTLREKFTLVTGIYGE